MKKILFIPLIAGILFAKKPLETSLDTLNKIPKQKIFNIFNPEILQRPKLEMIINQKAKINGKWYQKGQEILKYQIIAIQRNFVVLRHSKHILKLYTGNRK